MMHPVHPCVRLRVGGVIFTRVLTSSSVDWCHELPDAISDAMSMADMWRCGSHRCRRADGWCPCGRPPGYDSKCSAFSPSINNDGAAILVDYEPNGTSVSIVLIDDHQIPADAVNVGPDAVAE